MSYRKNVTDKQQGDVERAADDSADRFQWFDGKALQKGETKAVRAYDLEAQGNPGSTSSSAQRQIPGSGAVVGSHNDKPYVFESPGRGGPPSPTPPVPPSLPVLYRIDFSERGRLSQTMMNDGETDAVTTVADANFDTDGVDVWNRFITNLDVAAGDTVISLVNPTIAMTLNLTSSLGVPNAATLDLPAGQMGSGQGVGLRGGYIDFSADQPFAIHLGLSAASKSITLAWYELGAQGSLIHAITANGVSGTAQGGPAGVGTLTCTADVNGDVIGVFNASGQGGNNGALAGMQIYQAP